jgi:hypothetical protein
LAYWILPGRYPIPVGKPPRTLAATPPLHYRLGLIERCNCRNQWNDSEAQLGNFLFKNGLDLNLLILKIRFEFKQTDKMSSIPMLSSIHSGVPGRLSNEAAASKQKTYALKTLPTSVPRQNPLKLPPGVTRDVFDKAIDELRKVLGKDGVELNDKPLVDGWYMEHPFVSFSQKYTIKASS